MFSSIAFVVALSENGDHFTNRAYYASSDRIHALVSVSYLNGVVLVDRPTYVAIVWQAGIG